MDKKIVLISEGTNFMVNAIIKNLKEAGYEVGRIDPKISDINMAKVVSDIFVLYLGEYVNDIHDVLVFLRDVCLDEDKKIILVGYQDECNQVQEVIPDTQIEGTFERPLNVKNLITRLDQLVDLSTVEEQKPLILVIDDDAVFLNMVKGWLQEKYRVVLVNSGMRAITYLANTTPDLILMDYEMPVTNGPQVMEMLKSDDLTRNIPVMFLTGKNDRDSVLEVLALHPEGYLLKSSPKNETMTTIDNFFIQQRVKKAAQSDKKKM
ncbi:MAG: response regulator [Clostridia bacterium]|nr:response regulator [Clostridia bacterium]